jgi:hypothetical protein
MTIRACIIRSWPSAASVTHVATVCTMDSVDNPHPAEAPIPEPRLRPGARHDVRAAQRRPLVGSLPLRNGRGNAWQSPAGHANIHFC